MEGSLQSTSDISQSLASNLPTASQLFNIDRNFWRGRFDRNGFDFGRCCFFCRRCFSTSSAGLVDTSASTGVSAVGSEATSTDSRLLASAALDASSETDAAASSELVSSEVGASGSAETAAVRSGFFHCEGALEGAANPALAINLCAKR